MEKIYIYIYIYISVRLCKDRLELVHKAMQTRSSAYKNAQKLLKLGHLLRVPAQSSKVMEGKVLRLVAQAALEVSRVGYLLEQNSTV